MPRVICGLLSGLLLAGCSPELGPALRLELDPRPEHQTVIVSVGSALTGPLVAWDIDQGPQIALNAQWPSQGDLPVTALYYEQSLAELGLETEVLRRRESGLPIPTPDEVQRAQARSEQVSRWEILDVVPIELRDLHIVRNSPCAEFSVTFTELPFTGEVRGLIPITAREAWILVEGGELWRIDADGGAVLLASGLPDRTILTLAPNRLWLGGHGGRVLEVAIDGDLLTVTTTITVGSVEIQALAALPNETVPSFAVDSNRRLYGADGQDWKRLVRLRVEQDIGRAGGLLAFAPDDVLMGFVDGLRAYRWNGRELLEEEVPGTALSSGLTAFAHWPDYGTVIGTAVGELIQKKIKQDGWTKLEGAYAVADVKGLGRYDAGFVYNDETGVIVQYLPRWGYCPPIAPPPAAVAEGRTLAVFGEAMMTAGVEARRGPRRQAFWYHREPR